MANNVNLQKFKKELISCSAGQRTNKKENIQKSITDTQSKTSKTSEYTSLGSLIEIEKLSHANKDNIKNKPDVTSIVTKSESKKKIATSNHGAVVKIEENADDIRYIINLYFKLLSTLVITRVYILYMDSSIFIW